MSTAADEREDEKQIFSAVVREFTIVMNRAGYQVVNSEDRPHDLVARFFGSFTVGFSDNEHMRLELGDGQRLVDTFRVDFRDDAAIAARAFASHVTSSPELATSAERALAARPSTPTAVAVDHRAEHPVVATTALVPGAPPAGPDLAASAPPPSAFMQGPPNPAAFALVIGIEHYRDLPAPTGARADANQFAALARRTLGVPEENVLLAVDERATRGDIQKHLRWLDANVPKGGRIYLFFGGHGAPDPSTGTPFLVPYDGDPKALGETALRLSDVLDQLGRTRASDVVAFVDSCFSGAGGRSVLPAGARPLVPIASKQAVAGRLALVSAASGSEISGPASDGSGGLFTHYLTQGLGSGQADLDGDGAVTLQELQQWLTPRVARDARRDHREQTPSVEVGSGYTSADDVLLVSGIRH